MQYKVHNMIFMEAGYSFSMLLFYYEHMMALLHRSSSHSREFIKRLKIEHKQKQREFKESYWNGSQKVYDQVYPRFFNYSFLISACSLFEYQIKKICVLVKEEHKVPLEWDDMDYGSIPTKAKRYLRLAGVTLKDDPPTIILPPPDFVPTEVQDESRIVVSVLWKAIENYFMIRNCLVHHNGLINSARNSEKIKKYALEKGIISDDSDNPELVIDEEFAKEICNTMHQFFDKLHSAYYSTGLPE